MKVKLTDQDEIQQRQVGDAVPELTSLDPGLGQYQFGDLSQFVEFSKVMCQAGPMLPEHAQRNPAICLALTMRAVHWGFDPFALAFESFQAKAGGPVGFQAKVFTAVMRKAGVKLNYRYEGSFEKTGKPVTSARGNKVADSAAEGDRKCIAYVQDGDQLLEYETPTLDQITIKNSPLWHNDPDQQLAYYAGRGWARRHRADLMLGAYSDEEVQDMRHIRDVTPKETGFARLAQKARSEAATAPKEADTTTDPEKEEKGSSDAAEQADGADDADTSDASNEDAGEEHDIFPDGNAFQMGVDAATEGFPPRDESPLADIPAEHANWLAGYDSVGQEE